MKTAIAIDSLINRDDSIFLLELLLSLYPDSEIYTIAHKRGGVLGRIETRPIVSSFLSHKVSGLHHLAKNYWILPSAVEAIPLHKSIEKIMIISHGFIHGLKLPAHVDKYLYLLRSDLILKNQLGWQKIFSPYVENWRDKALTRFTKIAVSSESFKDQIGLPNAEVLIPTFKTEDYSFVRDEDHNFLFTHHLILTHGMNESEFKSIASHLLSSGEMIKVLGPDEKLKPVLSHPNLEFIGDHCEATVSLYSHQAKIVWDLSHSYFPSKAFGAFCTGRPAVVRDTPVNRELLLEGAYFISDSSDLKNLISQINHDYLSFDRKKLRRLGLKWNERLFKVKFKLFAGN
jgi:hypothetical protein